MKINLHEIFSRGRFDEPDSVTLLRSVVAALSARRASQWVSIGACT